jgi:prepilin-type N-terminal cleavage/methylation domain-containing protein
VYSSLLRKQAFTLTEVLFVLVIVGVLAGLAVPSYFGTVEKARESEAISNLKTLHSAQKIHRLNNNVYFGPSSSLSDINANLDIELEQQFFEVSIAAASATAYAAQAERGKKQGGDGAKCFKVTETGTVTGPLASCK